MFEEHSSPGRFIVFEGADGAGTTSMSKKIKHFYDLDHRASGRVKPQGIWTSEPSDPNGEIGNLIRSMINGRAPETHENINPSPYKDLEHFNDILRLLFAADRFDHIDRVVLPSLRDGDDVISDRYVYSSMVYQGDWPEDVFDVEPDMSALDAVVHANTGILMPDLIIFLDVDADVALERIDARNIEAGDEYSPGDIFESRDKVARHVKLYREVFKVMGYLAPHHRAIKRIDANRPFNDVLADCVSAVADFNSGRPYF